MFWARELEFGFGGGRKTECEKDIKQIMQEDLAKIMHFSDHIGLSALTRLPLG